MKRWAVLRKDHLSTAWPGWYHFGSFKDLGVASELCSELCKMPKCSPSPTIKQSEYRKIGTRVLILYFFLILYMLHLDLFEGRFADMAFNAAIQYWQNCGIFFFFKWLLWGFLIFLLFSFPSSFYECCHLLAGSL